MIFGITFKIFWCWHVWAVLPFSSECCLKIVRYDNRIGWCSSQNKGWVKPARNRAIFKNCQTVTKTGCCGKCYSPSKPKVSVVQCDTFTLTSQWGKRGSNCPRIFLKIIDFTGTEPAWNKLKEFFKIDNVVNFPRLNSNIDSKSLN